MTTPSEPAPVPRAYRATDERLLGGVAAGLADHLGLPVLWVRVAMLVLVVFGGFGFVLYAALWLFLPARPHLDYAAPGLEAASRQGRRGPRRDRRLGDLGPLVAVGAVVSGVVILTGAWSGQGLRLLLLLLGASGVALLWWQADQAQRERWQDTGAGVPPVRAILGRGGWSAWARLIGGLSLLIVAITVFSLGGGATVGTAVNVAVAVMLSVLAIALIAGPWLVRLSADLSEEREARVRTQERADVAAHLHDSVLQTLALIQRSADDSATVTRLARAQERDLRTWLFADEAEVATTLAVALRTAAAEIEDSLGVPVEVVCVGDAPLDADASLVWATREAMSNAARHSGAALVDVYAEARPDAVEVFVRDRGRGFDLDAIPEDRQGVRNSIVDRMRRHGGSAEIRTTPGAGTEVRLSMPLAPKETR